MRSKLHSIICNLSIVTAMYATIQNAQWKLPTPPADQHQFETLGVENKPSYPPPLLPHPDTTVIITSNYIPSHPSTAIIDETIDSLQFLEGLFPENCSHHAAPVPVIITVDGPYGRDRGPNSMRQQALTTYIKYLETRYKYNGHDNAQECRNRFNMTILPQKLNVKLIKNIQHALNFVKTEFVYVIQHDLPFVLPVSHSGLVATFRQHPDVLRLVRFGLHKTLSRSKDVPAVGECDDLFLSSNGVDLSKTLTWSDK